MALEKERPKPPTTTRVAVQFVIFKILILISILLILCPTPTWATFTAHAEDMGGFSHIKTMKEDDEQTFQSSILVTGCSSKECECGWPEAVINNREWISSFNSQKIPSPVLPCHPSASTTSPNPGQASGESSYPRMGNNKATGRLLDVVFEREMIYINLRSKWI